MNTADHDRTPRQRPTREDSTRGRTGHGRHPFLRHYLEMVIAMFVGMVVLGAAERGLLALAGLEFPAHRPELGALEMAFLMAVGMTVWMRYRGHGWIGTAEMAFVMFVPALVLIPLLWLGALSGDLLVLLEHVVMLPLMWLAMLRRRSEYGR